MTAICLSPTVDPSACDLGRQLAWTAASLLSILRSPRPVSCRKTVQSGEAADDHDCMCMACCLGHGLYTRSALLSSMYTFHDLNTSKAQPPSAGRPCMPLLSLSLSAAAASSVSHQQGKQLARDSPQVLLGLRQLQLSGCKLAGRRGFPGQRILELQLRGSCHPHSLVHQLVCLCISTTS